MIRWISQLWNDWMDTYEELAKLGVLNHPWPNYPFAIYINPEWFESKDQADK
jgi:hypothetical protein